MPKDQSHQASSALREEACLLALRAIDTSKHLPENVFQQSWSGFLFFESDRVFSSEFSCVLKELMDLEGSNISCLINLDESHSSGHADLSAIFVNGKSSMNDYYASLSKGGPSTGWVFGVDRFVCASNIGEWCIYIEKSNDIALIGFSIEGGLEKYLSIARKLHAMPIATLVAEDSQSAPPFNQLTVEWKTMLIKNY